MPASHPIATVAKIPVKPLKAILEADAIEDAVQRIHVAAMAEARKIAGAPRSPEDHVSAIYDDRIPRAARRLLTAALCASYGVNFSEVRKVLNSLSSIDHCGAYAHEAMEEFWEIIEDTARDEARDNRERMGE